jgi:hypothetical protein
MELHNQIEQISSKDDLANFIELLRLDFEKHKDEWQNRTLGEFLSAMEDWTRAMDQYYKNAGKPAVVTPNWSTFADILYAAKIYE